MMPVEGAVVLSDGMLPSGQRPEKGLAGPDRKVAAVVPAPCRLVSGTVIDLKDRQGPGPANFLVGELELLPGGVAPVGGDLSILVGRILVPRDSAHSAGTEPQPKRKRFVSLFSSFSSFGAVSARRKVPRRGRGEEGRGEKGEVSSWER
jgi:hypothetical protein